MRPVNLIPPEDRPGGRRPLRSGPLAYIVIGALAATVIAISALVVTDGKVSDRNAEVAQLEAEQTSITSKAQALAPYTQFSAVHESRLTTVTSLADSRFNWSRVLQELALVIPAGVRFTTLAGSASSESGGTTSSIGMRGQIAGPALEMTGCASSQMEVAGFIEALKDIDGVTRVGVPTSSTSAEEEGGNATSASTCGKSMTTQFQAVAGFDAAPVALPEEGGESAPEVAPETSEEGGSEDEESSESSTEEAAPEEGEGAS